MLSSATKQKLGDSTSVTERYCPAVANTFSLAVIANDLATNLK